MSVLRSKIVAALDELISQEGGMPFQALAVVLAKRRWPQLVASERKNDHGLDAHTRGELFDDGVEKGLASSITATLAKIKGDLAKAKHHFPDLRVLLFATPRTVQKAVQEKWREEILEEFGISLTVLSREDIITELQKPENAALCETHLGIPLPPREPTDEQLLEAGQAATRMVEGKWSRHLEGMPLIEPRLRAGQVGDEPTEKITQLEDLVGLLRTGHRIIVESPAGRGKTTLLTQLSRAVNAQGQLSFLIDLPAWIRQNVGVLDFIAGMPEFRARGITPANLASMEGRTQFTFLLNGWNELAPTESLSASIQLRELDRDHPAAGIAIATRAHPVKLPISGSERFQLLPFTRKQRSQYLLARFGQSGLALDDRLDNDTVLDELTRTPLVLAYVGSLFAAGREIPSTKTGVLNAVVDLMESEPQHAVALSEPPLAGFARTYLEDLGFDLMEQGTTQMAAAKARQVVASGARWLQESSQIATIPEPGTILRELTAHHVLEVTTYQDETFSFLHQQFQELLASQRLLRLLTESFGTPAVLRAFIGRFVNEPGWSEPLMMAAEQLGVSARNGAPEAGAALVIGALEVDPVFASELAFAAGPAVWNQVTAAVSARLRELYGSTNGHCRALGLMGMLATGSSDFGDVLIPLMSSTDDNARFDIYHRYDDFHLSSLGEGWVRLVSEWPEQARIAFYSSIIHKRRPPQSLSAVALADPSAAVQKAVVSALAWIGNLRDIAQLLTTISDDLLPDLLRELPADYIPEEARPRVRAFVSSRINDEQMPVRQRISWLEKAHILGMEGSLELLKSALDAASSSEIKEWDSHRLYRLIEMLATHDEPWVSSWVMKHIRSRALGIRDWKHFVKDVPTAELESLTERIRTAPAGEVSQGLEVYLIQAFGGVDEAASLFLKLCELDPVVRESRHGDAFEGERSMQRLIEEALRNMRPDAAIAGSLRAAASVDVVLALQLICDVFYTQDPSAQELGMTLSEEVKGELHAYLVNSAEMVLAAEDDAGRLKGEYGILLAEVGAAEDLPIFERLIEADVARLTNGRLARQTNFRSSQAQGATMSWTVWHVASIIRLAPEGAWNLLVRLFPEPEYEIDAAWGLFQLCLRQKLPPRAWARNIPNLSRDFTRLHNTGNTAEPRFWEPQRTVLAEILRARYQEYDNGEAESAVLRAERRRSIAAVLAEADPVESRDLVYDAFLNAPPQRWLHDGYARVAALEALLAGGGTLPYEQTFRVLEPVFANFRQERWNDQIHGRAAQAFALLLFTDNPAAGALQIQTDFATAPLNLSAVRTFVARIGYSGVPEVLEIVRQILSRPHIPENLGDGWVDAVARIGSPASREMLLDLITGADAVVPRPSGLGRSDRAAFELSKLFRTDDAVRERLLALDKSTLSPRGRDLLARVLLSVGTDEALLSCVGFLVDGVGIEAHTSFKLQEAFEEVFLQRVPISPNANAYRVSPRPSNGLRDSLATISRTDGPAQEGARRLLMRIEHWRLEHGRPNGEPRNPFFGVGVIWPPFCNAPME
jgi:hypothetical protein